MSRETALIRTACVRLCIAILLFLLAGASLAAETTSHKSPEGANGKVRRVRDSSKRRTKAMRRKRAKGPRGQQVISSERARQIQQALIRERYLEGEPSGAWDQRTKDAMTRYQAENGWQTKVTPDSRALIKLGLGPRHDDLLNPDSAALAAPHELGAERPVPGGR